MLPRVDRYVHVVALALVHTFGVYNHETRAPADKLTNLQHDHFDRFISTLHGCVQCSVAWLRPTRKLIGIEHLDAVCCRNSPYWWMRLRETSHGGATRGGAV